MRLSATSLGTTRLEARYEFAGSTFHRYRLYATLFDPASNTLWSSELGCPDQNASEGLGACDTGGSCNGTDGICHSVGVQPAGTECHAVAGACDFAEQCDGVSSACPQDAMVWSYTACHPSTGDCDPQEVCDGVSPLCPADAYSAAGAP